MARLYSEASIVEELDHLTNTVAANADDVAHNVLGGGVQFGLRRFSVSGQRSYEGWLLDFMAAARANSSAYRSSGSRSPPHLRSQKPRLSLLERLVNWIIAHRIALCRLRQ